MHRKPIIIFFFILLLCTIILTVTLFASNLVVNGIVGFTISILMFIFIIVYIHNSKSDELVEFEKEIEYILKKYDQLLIESNGCIEIEAKNVIEVTSLKQLLKVSNRTNKSIYYIKEETSCTFFIYDNVDLIIFIKKLDNDTLSAFDILLNEREQQENKTVKDEILEEEKVEELSEKSNEDIISQPQQEYQIANNEESPIENQEEIEIL